MLERFLPRIEFDSYEDFYNNYSVSVPDNFNFGFDIVDGWADKEPEKRALVWCDDHGNEKTLSFSDIKRLSNKTANFFKSIGLKKGSRVLLLLRRRWEYWVCAVALHKLGAVLIPATIQLTEKDIIYRATAANVEAMICVNDEFVVQQTELAMPKSPTVKNLILVDGKRDGWHSLLDAIEPFSEEFSRPTGEDEISLDDTMLIYFTSGTTGMPKMVNHNFRYPLGHIVTAKYWQCVRENRLHMSVSDSGWAKFGWGKIYGQWICGAVIFAYDMDKFVPTRLLEMLEKYRVTTFCAPPTMYRFMLQERVEDYDLSSLEQCCTAGEPLNPEVFSRWRDYTGLPIIEGFGQSEGPVILANFPWFRPKLGSTGKPSPLYDLRLFDENGKECKDGEEGEIVVCNLDKYMPLGLFTGYIGDDCIPRDCRAEGLYNLKDVAWRDSDGHFWFVGRHDDVIKCSGYRIGPFEVESALIEHPAVIECAITAVADEIRGQIVKATVVLAEGFTPSEKLTKELQRHVKKVTAPYKYPRIVEYVDELPKTFSGKVKRADLRKQSGVE
ncbi:AMP-binding protein [Clostridiaceae bacterium OttesenSCG-928-D20]|nr:AMP-binding protein [Clostridiaceae bacterium OttesenSCG-928-D20]